MPTPKRPHQQRLPLKTETFSPAAVPDKPSHASRNAEAAEIILSDPALSEDSLAVEWAERVADDQCARFEYYAEFFLGAELAEWQKRFVRFVYRRRELRAGGSHA